MTSVFRDAYRFWRVLHKYPKLKRSSSDVHDLHNEVELILSPDSVHSYCDCDFKSSQTRNNIYFLGRPYLPESLDDKESDDHAIEDKQCCSQSHTMIPNGDPFRNRASTDGNLSRRPRKWKYPSFSGTLVSPPPRIERRMSISMRGTNTNASYWDLVSQKFLIKYIVQKNTINGSVTKLYSKILDFFLMINCNNESKIQYYIIQYTWYRYLNILLIQSREKNASKRNNFSCYVCVCVFACMLVCYLCAFVSVYSGKKRHFFLYCKFLSTT